MATVSEAECSYMPLDASSGKAIELSMQRLVLTGKVLPVGARLLVRHDFASARTKPVEVVYSFVLPRDAALRRFRVAGPGFSAHSELKPVKEAVEDYERGLEKGHLGVLARGYRDGVINLSVGNLRGGDRVSVWLEILAGVDLRDDGLRFRFPFTMAPSYHSKMRAAQVDERTGELELPEEEFGDVLMPQWKMGEEGLHEVAFDLAVDYPALTELSSPSHAVRVRNQNSGLAHVSLAPAADAPNRDLVLDARSNKKAAPLVLAGEGKDGRGHFAAAVPSVCFGESARGRPPVVFVLDRSGSMSGAPITQARKALAACLAVLAEDDSFGIVAFDNVAESYRARLARATRDERHAAGKWLDGIDARGGTELVTGIRAAAGQLKAAGGGDVFLLTDGQVFGTEDILAEARTAGIRIHTLGIGSASQDRFLTLLSRETGGVGRFVTPRERVDTEALEVFASATGAVAKGLQVTTSGLREARIEPDPPVTVCAGVPLLLFGECGPGAEGSIDLQWGGGRLAVPVKLETGRSGDTLRLLRGSRLITDLESRVSAPPHGGVRTRREEDRVERHLEELSRHYGLASRVMALVAVVERAGDHPGAPPETSVVPVGLPQDMAFEGVFGLGASAMPAPALMGPAKQVLARARFGMLSDLCSAHVESRAAPPAERTADDSLMELAAKIEPDGGMPGKDESERILKTLLMLLTFAAQGHSESSGPFRAHMRRMLQFVESRVPGPLRPEQVNAARRALKQVRDGRPPTGFQAWHVRMLLVTGGNVDWDLV